MPRSKTTNLPKNISSLFYKVAADLPKPPDRICPLWKEYINKNCFRKFLPDKEDKMFALWFVWMAVYYCFRMFSLTPWYDELYTYYYFISRGPVYAAIHWPLPNNHVGYSVLSGFLDLLGNPVLGLRGISYLAALANLLLLYKIGKKCFSEGWSAAITLLMIKPTSAFIFWYKRRNKPPTGFYAALLIVAGYWKMEQVSPVLCREGGNGSLYFIGH